MDKAGAAAAAIGAECWIGPLNYERCCLPMPAGNQECFDLIYTPERCCHAAIAAEQMAHDSGWFPDQLVHIAVVETRDPRRRLPMRGVPGRMVRNLGVGETYLGHRTKVRLYSEWLSAEAKRDPHRLVILADFGDVLFGGCQEDQLVASYNAIVAASGASVVYGAEFGLWPGELAREAVIKQYDQLDNRKLRIMLSHGLQDGAYDGFYECQVSGGCWTPLNNSLSYRYLNSGWAMGPAGALQEVYSGRTSIYSDQLRATTYMLNRTEAVTLDYAAGLVLNLAEFMHHSVLEIDQGLVRNKVTGTVQCFVHGNGSGKKAWLDLLFFLHAQHSR